jgi:hypothetical protein
MSTTMLLLLSGVLIGAGISLIFRDVYKRQRGTFVLSRDAKAGSERQPEVEITVSRRVEPVLQTSAPAPAAEITLAAPASQRHAEPAETAPEVEALPRPDAARPSATAQQWAVLQPVISAAVEQVNSILVGVGVQLGLPGEPSFSIERAYGAHRRILVGGESVGWLRLQCTAEGTLNAAAKAHKDEHAEINAEAGAPAPGLSIARASDLLSECLKPTAAYAMRAGGGNAEQMASESAWTAVDALVIGALKAGNGALAQAGARLLPLTTPAWDPELGHHRMTVAVEVFGDDVARMHIDRLAQEVEVSVGVAEARLAHLGRRQRIAVEGMTTHSLAELIAGCAWPAIASHRETHRPA